MLVARNVSKLGYNPAEVQGGPVEQPRQSANYRIPTDENRVYKPVETSGSQHSCL
jgi:hypothetical protein